VTRLLLTAVYNLGDLALAFIIRSRHPHLVARYPRWRDYHALCDEWCGGNGVRR
jgi:hypothetical protein